MPRLQRLTDFIARLLGKEWDVRALDHQHARRQDRPVIPGGVGTTGRTGDARPDGAPGSSAASPSADSAASAKETAASGTADAGRPSSTGSRTPERDAPGHRDVLDRADDPASDSSDPSGSSGATSTNGKQTEETTGTLTLARIESMLTGPMAYNVQLADDREHPCLLGTWDTYPFVIEIPEGHDGWLLVSGDWEEAAPASQRDEIAASVNDWNRDKFFPTVGVVDTPVGPLVRATYLTDLSAGVTDSQLRLHLDTALSACTQALSLVGPLLPEI